MAVQPLVTGRTPDVYMDKVIRSLGDGDQYLDPIYLERELKNMAGGGAEKNVSTKAFFPSQTPKKRHALTTSSQSAQRSVWPTMIVYGVARHPDTVRDTV